jgi:hypothetical protein
MTALLYWPATAQNSVTVDNLVMKPGTVTFNVRWTDDHPAGFLWSDTVWVWVDYNNAGVMKRLPVTEAIVTAGSVISVPDNDSGVWVIGNARGAGEFSTTVKLFYTSPLDVTGACAYASNYPPEGRYVFAEEMVFTGTPPYEVVVEDAGGASDKQESGNTFTVTAGRVVTSFTDKTGAPGGCIPMLGELGFSISPNDVVREQPATFTVSPPVQAPAAFAVTYHWSAPGFGTSSGTGTTFHTTAPATAGVHTVTLTATAEGHCDKVVKATVQTCGTLSAPTGASASARCGSGTVTFSATPPSGCTIDWYTASSGGSMVSGGSGTTSFSPTINSTTTYYAQARNTTTGCVSASRLPVTATIGAVPATPGITRVSAATVCQNTNSVFRVTAPATGATYTWSGNPAGTASGTGNGTYTVSGAATGTKSVSVRSSVTAGGVTCPSANAATVTAVVQTLPATPGITRVSAATVCQNTNSVFRVTAPANGATYTWSGNPAGTASGTGNGTYTVSGSATGTKSVSVRSSVTAGGVTCPSAYATTVTAVVQAFPTITRTGGAVSQAVYQNSAITAIVYSAPNSTIARTSGSFPTGVTGAASGASFTISGSPSATGTYNYTVTATTSAGGCKTASSGTLTVKPDTPPTAYTTQTWTYGSLTWSDRVVAQPSACTKTTSLSTDAAAAEYIVKDGYYYYTWACVNTAATELCPSVNGWRVTLDPDCSVLAAATNQSTLLAGWSAGGRVQGSVLSDAAVIYLWCNTRANSNTAHMIKVASSGINCTNNTYRYMGLQVRCVK